MLFIQTSLNLQGSSEANLMLVTGDVGDGMLVTNFMYVRDESIFVTKKNVGDDVHMLVTKSICW